MFARQKNESVQAVKGGAIAGIVGGIAIALYMLVGAAVRGVDAWPVLKISGMPFLGARVMRPGFDGPAVVVGILSLFAVSVAWGILFGLIFWGLSKSATIVAGAIWGIAVWLGMYYVVLPTLGLGAMARGVPIRQAILQHVVFGLFVGIGFLPFQRESHGRYDAGRPVGPPPAIPRAP